MAIRAFPVVITDASEMQRLYREEFGVETSYIAYGANIEPSRNPRILKQYGLESGDYYLIASRLVPDNNADLIIKAFVRSKSQRFLAIAGSADYRGNRAEETFLDALRAAANEKVRFLGHIDSSEHIKELHHHCFAYIHGHQFGGINPSLLKALGYSNCILALDTPFSREVLDDGRYGILFDRDVADLATKIRRLEAQPEIAEGFRQRATEPIQDRFNWDLIAHQYLELFTFLEGKNP